MCVQNAACFPGVLVKISIESYSRARNFSGNVCSMWFDFQICVRILYISYLATDDYWVLLKNICSKWFSLVFKNCSQYYRRPVELTIGWYQLFHNRIFHFCLSTAIYDRYLLIYRVLWLRMRARWQITGIRLCNNGASEAKGSTHRAFWVQHLNYRKIHNIRRTKSQNLNNFRLVSQVPLPNPLKPAVKLRMNNIYCLIFCTNLIYISDLYRRSRSSWYSTQSMTWNPVILLNTMPVGDILQHFLGNNQAYLQRNLLQQNTNVKVYCTREVTQMRTISS